MGCSWSSHTSHHHRRHWSRCYHSCLHTWHSHHSVLKLCRLHSLLLESHLLCLTLHHHNLLILNCDLVHVSCLLWICKSEGWLCHCLSSNILLSIRLHLLERSLCLNLFDLTFKEFNFICITFGFSLFDLDLKPSFITLLLCQWVFLIVISWE